MFGHVKNCADSRTLGQLLGRMFGIHTHVVRKAQTGSERADVLLTADDARQAALDIALEKSHLIKLSKHEDDFPSSMLMQIDGAFDREFEFIKKTPVRSHGKAIDSTLKKLQLSDSPNAVRSKPYVRSDPRPAAPVFDPAAPVFDPAAAGPSRRDTSQYDPLSPPSLSCSPRLVMASADRLDRHAVDRHAVDRQGVYN
jgi:hypothetical protein